MTLLVQPCVGPNGNNVSNANASGGNQWNTVGTTGTGTTCTYDNTHTIHGNATAIKLHFAQNVSSTAYCQWKASIPSPTANSYERMYIYVAANPSVNIRYGNTATGSGSPSTAWLQMALGTVRAANSAGGNIATTTEIMPKNQWVRLEHEVTGISGTTGNVALRLYSGANLEGLTPDTGGSVSGSGAAVGGLINDFRIGCSAATTENPAYDIWISDVAWSDTAQPGPLPTSVPFIGWGVQL